MAAKKQNLIILEPKTEIGKERIGYHGERWYLIDKLIPKFARTKGECYVCRSRDGSKVLMVRVENDPDIAYRLLQ